MEKKHSQENWFMETLRTVGFAVVLAVGIKTFFYQTFNIPSESMVNTLLIGDYLFVSKFSYGYSKYSLPFSPNLFSGRIFSSQPKVGDVVVFRPPHDPDTPWIKRVIGVPGDEIQMREGILHINDAPVTLESQGEYIWKDANGEVYESEQYIETLPNGVKHAILKTKTFGEGKGDNTPRYTVPEGHYFMMGDNRDHSTDSRFSHVLGFVPHENLEGRADLLFFSTEIPTDPEAHWSHFWKWPLLTRFSRMFTLIR